MALAAISEQVLDKQFLPSAVGKWIPALGSCRWAGPERRFRDCPADLGDSEAAR